MSMRDKNDADLLTSSAQKFLPPLQQNVAAPPAPASALRHFCFILIYKLFEVNLRLTNSASIPNNFFYIGQSLWVKAKEVPIRVTCWGNNCMHFAAGAE
jgi:hypothetical protein